MISAKGEGQVAVLYGELRGVVYRRCLRLLRDRESARDATQDIFLKVARNLSQFNRVRGDQLRWISGIITHQCLDMLRERKRRREKEAGAALLATQPPAFRDANPDRQLAHQVLARFDPKTQAIAVGALVDELEMEDLATRLGISRRTVSRKLDLFVANARKFVARSELSGHG